MKIVDKKITILLFSLLFIHKIVYAQTTLCTTNSNLCTGSTKCVEKQRFKNTKTCKIEESICENNSDCCSGLCDEFNQNGKTIKKCSIARICNQCIPDGQPFSQERPISSSKEDPNQGPMECCAGLFNFENYCISMLPPPTSTLGQIVFKDRTCGKEIEQTKENEKAISDFNQSQHYFYAFEFLLMNLYEKIHIRGQRNSHLSYFNFIADLFEIAKAHFIGRVPLALAKEKRTKHLEEVLSKIISKEDRPHATNDAIFIETQKTFITESYFTQIGNTYAVISPMFKIARENIDKYWSGGDPGDHGNHRDLWKPQCGADIIHRGSHMCSARTLIFDETIAFSDKKFRILIDPIDPSWPLSSDSLIVSPEYSESQYRDCLNCRQGTSGAYPIRLNDAFKIPEENNSCMFCAKAGNPVWNTMKKVISQTPEVTDPFEYYSANPSQNNDVNNIFIPMKARKIIETSQADTRKTDILVDPFFCQANIGNNCVLKNETVNITKEYYAQNKDTIPLLTMFKSKNDDIFNMQAKLTKLEDKSYKWFSWHWRHKWNGLENSRKYYIGGNREKTYTLGQANQGIFINTQEQNLKDVITKSFIDYADKHGFVFTDKDDKSNAANIAYELFFRLADPGTSIWSEKQSSSSNPLDRINIMNLPYWLYFQIGDRGTLPHIGYYGIHRGFLSEILNELEIRSIQLAKQYGAFGELFSSQQACLTRISNETNQNRTGRSFSGQTGPNHLSTLRLERAKTNLATGQAKKDNTKNNATSTERADFSNVDTGSNLQLDQKNANSNLSGTTANDNLNTQSIDPKASKNLAIAQKDLENKSAEFKKKYANTPAANVQDIINKNFEASKSNYASKSTTLPFALEKSSFNSSSPEKIQSLELDNITKENSNSLSPKKVEALGNDNNQNESMINPFGTSNNYYEQNSNTQANKAQSLDITPNSGSQTSHIMQINPDININLFDLVSSSYIRSGVKRLKGGNGKKQINQMKKIKDTNWP